MTYKIKKMINNGTEYKIGSIDSSNETYENIIHLSQEEYDALETKDPDTLYSTPDTESPGVFNPENEGTTGQVLKKTSTGYRWDNLVAQGKYIDLIVVGGGGAGGARCGGGGGGGRVEECLKLGIDDSDISITVGLGGQNNSCNGCDSCIQSSYIGTIVAYGGGGGAGKGGVGCAGGNGGGAGAQDCGDQTRAGGVGCFGGNQGGASLGYNGGGGGGGAGGPGISGGTSSYGGIGGQGYNSRYFCTNCYFGTGGSGSYVSSGNGTIQAFPGGGTGQHYNGGAATFYGGGGGGGGVCGGSGGVGCQGVVMLRYPTDGSYGITSSTGGDCCFTCDGYCYVEFTQDGTFCIES